MQSAVFMCLQDRTTNKKVPKTLLHILYTTVWIEEYWLPKWTGHRIQSHTLGSKEEATFEVCYFHESYVLLMLFKERELT